MKKTNILLFTLLSLILCGCKNKEKEEIDNSNNFKNLIIVIGDGMGNEHISSLEMVNNDVRFTNWNYTISNTNSYGDNDLYITHTTDSAASGTSLATGTITNNGYIGKDKDGNDLQTILDYAKSLNKSTGIITTDNLYGATPMAFSSHSLSRNNTEELINNQIISNVDVLMGNYSSTIDSFSSSIIDNGYSYITNIKDINTKKINKLYYQENLVETSGDIELVDMVNKGIDILDNNDNGYCLMIEQAYIDKFSHNNDFENMLKAMNSLNTSLNYLIDNVSDDTAIIVTADHETGELRVKRNDSLLNSFSYNNDQILSYSWGSTSHSKNYVPVYTNFDYSFKSLPFYNSNHLIKNADIYNIGINILN